MLFSNQFAKTNQGSAGQKANNFHNYMINRNKPNIRLPIRYLAMIPNTRLG